MRTTWILPIILFPPIPTFGLLLSPPRFTRDLFEAKYPNWSCNDHHKASTFLSLQKGDNDSDMMKQRICVLSDDETQTDAGVRLSESLGIPFITEEASDLDWFHHALILFRYTAGTTEGTAIGIQSLGGDASDKKSRKRQNVPRATPFFIDFCPPEGSKLDRRTKGQSGTDLLVKAVGPGKRPTGSSQGAVIFDLTAGFGQDALILAKNGASHVHMIERDPIVATLLQDALDRLKLLSSSDDTRQEMASELVNRMSLQVGEGYEAVKSIPAGIPPPDCVYLDPMFAPRTKSSAVKKNMQILHSLLRSQETDEADMNEREIILLEAAIHAAGSRVVVKRPIQAPPLGGYAFSSIRKPSHEMKGSVNRWDVYVN